MGDEDDYEDGDGDLTESYHTLKRKPSLQDDPIPHSDLKQVGLPDVTSLSKGGDMKMLTKADLPEMFQKSTLTGFKNLKESTTGAPSCFCEKQGPCKKHT